MTAKTALRFTREMGLTRDDFFRSLPMAIAPLEYAKDELVVTIPHPNGEVVIKLHDSTERRIAALVLPVIPVEFIFTGLSDQERNEFMDRFDRYFHRGGG